MNYDANLFDSLELNEQNSTNGGFLFDFVLPALEVCAVVKGVVDYFSGLYNDGYNRGYVIGRDTTLNELLGR